MTIVYAILVYGFPLILLWFEWGLRTVIGVDSWGFTGPTLAAAGLSFLVPLTKPKVIITQATPTQRRTVMTSRADLAFVGVVWILVLAFLFLWAGACFSSVKHPDDVVYGLSIHFAIGLGVYFVGMVMTFIKELV